ncbi:WD40 repeat-containing protein [Histoplasma capsulatum var. duboisii H88]|uniref:WD40 repeat-containing protein n=1 Tax=Ajellomyces capsulatus (strain H88) TaxID=544711 RepID=F0U706_AJEC8|nr:WD40 repeat-containing protein [Histoplasma capsulatum var. duboisii H88]
MSLPVDKPPNSRGRRVGKIHKPFPWKLVFHRSPFVPVGTFPCDPWMKERQCQHGDIIDRQQLAWPGQTHEVCSEVTARPRHDLVSSRTSYILSELPHGLYGSSGASHEWLPIKRSPNFDMDQTAPAQKYPNMAQGAGPQQRGQGKSVRVAFGPQVDEYIPPSNNAPSPTAPGHQRARTTVAEQLQSNGRPNSSQAPSSSADGNKGTASPAVTRNLRPIPALIRAKSEHFPKFGVENGAPHSDDEDFQLRHGWHEEYTSSEYLKILNSRILTPAFQSFYMYFTEKRHETSGIPRDPAGSWPSQDWRMRDRLKTVSAALAICLNIGVDPPDVVKTNPTSKLECWVDPTSTTGAQNKVMEQIGKKLQEQYETLSLRTRYKQYLDPSVDETKKFCISLRRNAKDERVLFHYNGHGVPLPTQSGELWVFNKNYTQYIPVSLYDLQTWLAGPSLFVFDVSHAGNIVHNFQTFVEKHEKENIELRKRDPNALIQHYGDCILLAACERTETLPTNPNLPADLFTCCLTTPIEIALRYFILQNPLHTNISIDDFRVPGRLQDRRSPLGELNWIFTAITDTIAWNTLPRPLFKKLFRQDLMVAALFRNFLLAERIMRAHECHPISSPKLPETHTHPLWQSWDLAIEMVLAQLPALIEHEEGKRHYDYQHSSFFAEQLTAFEVYLSSGPTEKNPPDQLPIVLQVLLSQAHRLRALILLSKFLDLGPWAVHLALSIGIFPYVVKLLQSTAQELKPVMVFIWARIMAVDHTVQNDLLKDNGIHYFITILSPASPIPVGNASEHRAMCAFIVAIFCKYYPQGQNVCLAPELFEACLTHLMDVENPLLRQWSCLCLSMLWLDFPEAKWVGIRCSAPSRLCELTLDPVPEVRAAMLHALTSFIGIPELTDQVAQIEESLALTVMPMGSDGSVLVRKELLVFLSTFVKRCQGKFLVAAYEQLLEERHILLHQTSSQTFPNATGPIRDECPNNTILARSGNSSSCSKTAKDEILKLYSRVHVNKPRRAEQADLNRSLPVLPPAQSTLAPKTEGYLSLSFRRTASVAASLKNLAFGSGGNNERPQSPVKSASVKHRVPITPRGRAPAEWTRPPEVNDQPATSGSYRQARIPLSRGFQQRDITSIPTIPLESKFLDWSTEYFREPQMKPNESDEPGSADYNERLWRRSRNEKIITDTQPLKERAGTSRWDTSTALLSNPTQPTKMCFHQFEDHIAVADDRDTVWYDISARSGSCITSLTSDQVAGNIFIAGFGDGAVRVFDQRLKPTTAMVKVWREHKQWITNIHMQRGGVRELISGSRNGEVRLWDLRMDTSIDIIHATRDTLRTLAVHEHAPVFTIGTNRHEVKTFNTDGTYLSTYEPHASFLHSNRSSPIMSTAFHPHRTLLACAALNDNHINLVSC